MDARTVKQKPTNNVYSAMVFIAFIALVIGVSVVWWKNTSLTGEEYRGKNPGSNFPNPFYIMDKPAG